MQRCSSCEEVLLWFKHLYKGRITRISSLTLPEYLVSSYFWVVGDVRGKIGSLKADKIQGSILSLQPDLDLKVSGSILDLIQPVANWRHISCSFQGLFHRSVVRLFIYRLFVCLLAWLLAWFLSFSIGWDIPCRQRKLHSVPSYAMSLVYVLKMY